MSQFQKSMIWKESILFIKANLNLNLISILLIAHLILTSPLIRIIKLAEPIIYFNFQFLTYSCQKLFHKNC